MQNEESRVNKEICFVIAKFLQSQYPEVGNTFIRECEKYKLFPSSVFLKDPSYEELCTTLYPQIPSDQLINLLKLASPKMKYPSVLRPLTQHKSMIEEVNKKQFRPVKRIISHSFLTYCMQIDKTSQILITQSDHSIIKVWKLPELSLINSFLEHDSTITDIQIHPSNQYFASCSEDGLVCLFSLFAGVCIYKVKFDSGVHSITFSANGKNLSVSTENNGLIFIKEILCQKPKLQTIKTHSKSTEVWWYQNSPSSEYGYFVVGQNSIYSISISDNHSLMIFESPNCIANISVSKSQRFNLICEFVEKSIFFVLKGEHYDLPDKYILKIDHEDIIVDVQRNSDETLIVALSKHSGLYVWDLNSLHLIYYINNKTYFDDACMLVVSPIDPYIVCLSNNEEFISFWDISKYPIQAKNHVKCYKSKNSFNLTNDFKIQDRICQPISSILKSDQCLEGCWSPDGQSIIISDDDKGFVLLRQTLNDCLIKTEHQYLLKERDKVERAIKLYDLMDTGDDVVLNMLDIMEQHKPNSNEINDFGNVLVDNCWNPINPQPKRFKIHELNLRVQIK